MWKQICSAYLSFTKKERTGIAVVLSLVTLLVTIPYLFTFFIKPPANQAVNFETAIAALNVKLADSSKNYHSIQQNDYVKHNWKDYSKPNHDDAPLPSERFSFNPNTASADDWKRLGVKDKTVVTIQKYISKGGKFYKPDDILKVWGLQNALGESLVSLVNIPKEVSYSDYKKPYETKTYEKSASTVVDVNAADTSALIALPGIGSKLSQRIITYREKLGGFYKVEQVAETFGLADSVFQKIKPRLAINDAGLQKLNINTATLEELKNHPYLRFALANALVQYRVQHGNFSTVTDIKKIVIITDEVYNKMSPYLTVR